MSLKDKATALIGDYDNSRDAAVAIYEGPRDLALYVLQVGVEKLGALRRRAVRTELRQELQPHYVKGKTTGSIVLSPKSKRKVIEMSERLFTEWQIDATITLGNATREELLSKAQAERASSKGHIRTAMFYEAIAEPLKPGQRVMEYWRQDAALKVKRQIWRETKDARPALRE
jgi:hypothetical protein